MQLIPNKISFSTIENEHTHNRNLTVKIARFDLIHPTVSGNKIFKLNKYLEKAKAEGIENLVTMGGAYSNHLLATAYVCRDLHIKSYGMVRGEETGDAPSHTLKSCIDMGMGLIYVPRKKYKLINESTFEDYLTGIKSSFLFVPEGGFHPIGAAGAAEMMNYLQDETITHIVTAVGTGTTLAGLLCNNPGNKKIIAVPVIKNMEDIFDRIQYLTGNTFSQQLEVWDQYHRGGYAKTDQEIFKFMNEIYQHFEIPTDIIYTSKMLYALLDKVQCGFFPAGSHIVGIHTGGLQGNLSLDSGVLNF